MSSTGDGPNSFEVHKYLPYLAHEAGYQILQATSSSKIPCISTHVHPNRNVLFEHLIIGSRLSICCQNQEKIQATEQAEVRVFKSATTKV